MAKNTPGKTTKARTSRKAAPAAEAAAAATDNQAVPEADAATNEIPAATGGEAKPGDAAASESGTEPKASENENNSGAADPVGTEAAPAAASEEPREQAEAAPADRKGAAEEGEEPGATARPPVAGPVFVVTGPRRGFRRAGFAFGPEPRELAPADFGIGEGEGATPEQLERLLAILSEPALKVVARRPDGAEDPVEPELVERLRALAEARRAADA